MIKNIRVTVDGKPFDVSVEIPDEAQTASHSGPIVSKPVVHSAPADGDIPSPLSGHVVAVPVTVGQVVKKGDAVISIEAMKMNTAVTAPHDGKVSAVHVKVGDVVGDGQPLVRLE